MNIGVTGAGDRYRRLEQVDQVIANVCRGGAFCRVARSSILRIEADERGLPRTSAKGKRKGGRRRQSSTVFRHARRGAMSLSKDRG